MFWRFHDLAGKCKIGITKFRIAPSALEFPGWDSLLKVPIRFPERKIRKPLLLGKTPLLHSL
jgi:hypothetical protein